MKKAKKKSWFALSLSGPPLVSLTRSNDTSIINEVENGLVLNAVWEFKYLLVFVSLFCLWAPEAGAKGYAYGMELSATGNYRHNYC